MLQTSLVLMKSLNKTETPISLSVECSLFTKAIFGVDFTTLQLVLVPCGGIERLPVLYYSADYILLPSGSLGPLWNL